MSTGYSENSLIRRVQTIADYQFGGNAGTGLFPKGARSSSRLPGGYARSSLRDPARDRPGLGWQADARYRRSKAPPGTPPGPGYRVIIREDVAEFVAKGKNMFAKHVVAADPQIRAGDDVIVVAENDRLIACGAAVVSGAEMIAFNYGVAVRVRQGVEKDASGKYQPTPDEGDDEEARHECRVD